MLCKTNILAISARHQRSSRKLSTKKTLCVFIPVYNEEEFLQETLESVMAQTVKFDEYILIDDGSTDKTSSIYKIETFSCFRIIKNNKNQGLLPILNAHMSKVRSSHVIFLSGNDLLHHDFVSEFHACCDDLPEVGIFSSYSMLQGDYRRTLRKSDFLVTGYSPPRQVRQLLCFGTLLVQPINVFDVELVKLFGFDERLLGVSDLVLGCDIAAARGFYFSSKPLGVARLHEGQYGNTSRSDVLRTVWNTHAVDLMRSCKNQPVITVLFKFQILLELLSCMKSKPPGLRWFVAQLTLAARLLFLGLRYVFWRTSA